MAISYNTALRNFLQSRGSMQQAMYNGKMIIYSGSAPTSPNDTATGTTLVTITDSAGTHTAEVRATGTMTITSAVTTDGLTALTLVHSNIIIPLIDRSFSMTTDNTVNASTVVKAVNDYSNMLGITASYSTNVVTLTNPPNVGDQFNTNYFTITPTSTGTVSIAVDGIGQTGNGTDPANGLKFTYSASGILTKYGTWSGTVASTGTAGYFRLYSADSTLVLQGTCGTSGADYNMSSTSLTSGNTHTVDTFQLTLPE